MPERWNVRMLEPLRLAFQINLKPEHSMWNLREFFCEREESREPYVKMFCYLLCRNKSINISIKLPVIFLVEFPCIKLLQNTPYHYPDALSKLHIICIS